MKRHPFILCLLTVCFFFYQGVTTHAVDQKIVPEDVLQNVCHAIYQGIDRKLTVSAENEKLTADTHTVREFFVATELKKFVDEVPEFIQIAAIFFLEGGFKHQDKFSFDHLFNAIDHGAIRVSSTYLQAIPTIFQALGLTTPTPSEPEYKFIPTGKPLQANAYGPFDAYGKKDLNQFRLFVTELRLDLLPDNIRQRTLGYMAQSLNPIHERLQELAGKKDMTMAEAKDYAELVVHDFLSKKKDALSLKDHDKELYFILKKAVPEVFNALVFGPQLNHLAIDLRKSGVDKWAGKEFEKGIDTFFDDIGQPSKNGRADNGKKRWGLLTLDSVQGALDDKNIKIRQTSVKVPVKDEKDNCCYIEFVTRLPEDPTLAKEERETAAVYEGFHTYNATEIYTSNRSDQVLDVKKQDYNDTKLQLELEQNIKTALQEFQSIGL